MRSTSTDSTGSIAADAAESGRLMAELSIIRSGRYYYFDGYRYELLAHAIAFAQLVQAQPSRRTRASALPIGDADQEPGAADRQCMHELSISYENHRFVFEGFHYDRLIDAANYARHCRQRSSGKLGETSSTGLPANASAVDVTDRAIPFERHLPSFGQRRGATMTTRRWIDWVNVILGAWLLASPWLLPEAGRDGPAAWSWWSAGIGVVTLALVAMRKPTILVDATGVVLGIWLIASPWVLGFASTSAAAANAMILGSLVIVYALWAVRIDSGWSERARTAHSSSPARPSSALQAAAGPLGSVAPSKKKIPEGNRRQPFGRASRAWSRRPWVISRAVKPRGGPTPEVLWTATAKDAPHVDGLQGTGLGRVGPSRRQRDAENRWENEGGATRR